MNIDTVNIPPIRATVLHSFYISDPRTIKRLNGCMSIDRTEFLGIVSTQLLRRCSYLSASKHHLAIYNLVDRFLTVCGITTNDVKVEPEKVVAHIKECLDSLSRQIPAQYISLSEQRVIDLEQGVFVNVPETFTAPIDSISFDLNSWETRLYKGLPFSGWRRSLLVASPFDQVNELKIAKIIDRSDEVDW